MAPRKPRKKTEPEAIDVSTLTMTAHTHFSSTLYALQALLANGVQDSHVFGFLEEVGVNIPAVELLHQTRLDALRARESVEALVAKTSDAHPAYADAVFVLLSIHIAEQLLKAAREEVLRMRITGLKRHFKPKEDDDDEEER